MIASASNTTCRKDVGNRMRRRQCQASLGHRALDRLPHTLADEIRAKLSDLCPSEPSQLTGTATAARWRDLG